MVSPTRSRYNHPIVVRRRAQKSQKVVATAKALTRSPAARKRGPGVVVPLGLTDAELVVGLFTCKPC